MNESGALGGALAQLGQCGDRLSVLVAEEAERESLCFLEPVRDYVRWVLYVSSSSHPCFSSVEY